MRIAVPTPIGSVDAGFCGLIVGLFPFAAHAFSSVEMSRKFFSCLTCGMSLFCKTYVDQ